MQQIILDIVLGLFKLGILVVFTTAIIQVIKGISGVGFFKMIFELLRTLVRSKDKNGNPYPVSEETWKTLNFVIALAGLKLLNFTLMSAFLGLDLETLSKGAAWFDYIATASVLYMGTEWFFKSFGSLITEGMTFKKSVDGLLSDAKNAATITPPTP